MSRILPCRNRRLSTHAFEDAPLLAISLAILGAAVVGSGDFLGGVASRRTATSAVVVASLVVGSAVAAITAPFVGGAPTRTDLLWGAASGVAGGFAVLALYEGFAKSRVGVVSPISAVGAAVIPVVFGLTVGEGAPLLSAAGFVCGIIAIGLISSGGGGGGGRIMVGVRYGILAGAGFGVLLITLGQVSDDSGIWPVLPGRLAGVALLLVIALMSSTDLVPDRRSWPAIFGVGVLTTMGNALFVLAVQRGPLPVVTVLYSMFPAATVLLARVFFDERLRRVQLAGIGLALLAVALISIGTTAA